MHLRSAQRLLSAKSAALILRRESEFFIAAYSAPGLADTPLEVRNVPLDRDKNFPSRVILDGEVLHIADWEADDVPEHEKVVAKAFGIGSGLQVPLLREAQGIGALVVTRQMKGQFQEKEIALLRSFADQAVIAIENVRRSTKPRKRSRGDGDSEVLKVHQARPGRLGSGAGHPSKDARRSAAPIARSSSRPMPTTLHARCTAGSSSRWSTCWISTAGIR